MLLFGAVLGILQLTVLSLSNDIIIFEDDPILKQIDKCSSKDIKRHCVEFSKCRSANQNNIFHLKRCGAHNQKICCPVDHQSTTESAIKPTENTHSRLNDRKAVQVCEEYTNDNKSKNLTYHILDGEDAKLGEFPHMVALGYKTIDIGEIKWSCGGTLISDRYVLTAAHCIINSENNPPVKAKMGMINITATHKEDMVQEFDIENITVYPDYNWKRKTNDIALIKLNAAVNFTEYVHPACVYDKTDNPKGLLITGWGTTSFSGDDSQILQKASLEPVDLTECNRTYMSIENRRLFDFQICALDSKSDTCQGDSGGPLQIQNNPDSEVYSIVGITSFGLGCGSKFPGVYTRVSSYLDWIENIVWGTL